MQLVRIGLEHPDIRYEIFYGVSDNARGWWDNAAAFRSAIARKAEPRISATRRSLRRRSLPTDPIAEWYQGGPFCSDEFSDGIEHAPL